jgi:DNA-binding MarR family transcriptional regulator
VKLQGCLSTFYGEAMQRETADDPLAEQVAADLSAVVGRLLRRLRTASPDSLLTPTQRTVLARLDGEGPATTAALARAEYVRPQSMRLTLAALEERDFVARTPDPDDGRQSVVAITENGRSTLASVRAAKHGWLVQALAGELDEAELRTLAEATALMERLVEK